MISWVGLLNREEVLLYLDLFYFIIGGVGYWVGVFFGVIVIVGFIIY